MIFHFHPPTLPVSKSNFQPSVQPENLEKNEILFDLHPLAGCFWNGLDSDFDNVRNAVRRVRGSHADYVNDTASQR